jgi:phosphatidylglycerol:prolipoprotein diacylglycerol transferase
LGEIATPYFELPPLRIGPVTVRWFVWLLGAAILTGHFLFLRRCRRLGLDVPTAAAMNLAMVAAGFAAGVMFSLLEAPGGIASQGLMFGGAAGAWLYALARRMRFAGLMAYAHAGVFVFPFAWLVARAACVVAHDHPGARSESWLAVAYPGGARWDLGLLEFLYTGLIALLFLWLDRRRSSPPYVSVFVMLYGAFRMLITPLRADPPRYFALALEQWTGAAMVLTGAALYDAKAVYGVVRKLYRSDN